MTGSGPKQEGAAEYELAALKEENRLFRMRIMEWVCEKCNHVFHPSHITKKDSKFYWCPTCDVPVTPLWLYEDKKIRSRLSEQADLIDRLKRDRDALELTGNPNCINCDGLPNTPHAPIGIIKGTECPACAAISANKQMAAKLKWIDEFVVTVERKAKGLESLAESFREKKVNS